MKTGPEKLCDDESGDCAVWTADTFEALKRLITNQVPEGKQRREAMKWIGVGPPRPDPIFLEHGVIYISNDPIGTAMERIEQRLDPRKTLVGENELAEIWTARERETPAPVAYEKSHARQWRELGCAAEGAPYVLHGLVAQLRDPFTSPFRAQSDEAKDLASAFLEEAHCVGAHGLPRSDKATLKEIAPPATPRAPKP